jgi:hypothetical protein
MSLQSDWDDPGTDPGDGNRKAVPNTTISSSMINWILYSIANVDLPNHEGRITNLENAGYKKITIGTEAAMPASGSTDELYVTTDTNKFYRGTGTGWQEVCITWDGVVSQLEAVGSKNKAYDSDLDGIFDLSTIPSLPRSRISDFFSSPFWGNIPDKPSAFTPTAHANTHADGGSDELSLDASQITSGVFATARIPNLDASKITSGRFAFARLPTSATANRFLVVRSANGDPVYDLLAASDIPDLDASKITSGVFSIDRIPDMSRSKITDFFSSPFWGNIPDKPSTFPPSSHTHPVADLTDHTKAVHDALGIDAATLDGNQASDLIAKNMTDQTANRALGTVYQNTTNRHLLVFVVGKMTGGSSTYKSYYYGMSVYIGSTSSPDQLIWYKTNAGRDTYTGTLYDSCVFIVPPNYYYKVTNITGGSGNPTNAVHKWWEVEI